MGTRLGLLLGLSALAVSPFEAATATARLTRMPLATPAGYVAYKCGDSLCLARPDGMKHRLLLSGGHRPWPQWDPAFAPNGRLIAFRGYYAPGDGSYALYIMGTNGCAAKRLTQSIAGNPSWSPDARWIAFDMSGAGEIWKVRADGTHPTRLARSDLAASPSWSPGGATIAFTRTSHARGQIWTVHPDGRGARLLHTDALVGDQMAQPAWSHDGRRIAFVAQVGKRAVIKIMRADGADVQVLTKRFAGAWNPVWLPHDSGIAFLAGPVAFGPGTLFVMRRDGSRTRRLARLKTEQLAWSSSPLPPRSC